MKKLLLLVVLILLGTPALAQSSVVLQWDASASANVSYNIYRSKTTGGCPNGTVPVGCAKANAAPVSVLTFTDSLSGTGRWFYIVRAVDTDGVESDNSNELAVVVRPAPPTNLRKL